MYIMTHFMKNVLTFLLQYDIYISFCSKFVLGQKLSFALSEPLSSERREPCIISNTTTPLHSTVVRPRRTVWCSLSPSGTTWVSLSG